MNIAFEINHPAQAHLFKNPIRSLIIKQHRVTVFVKDNPITQSILTDFNIPFLLLGKKGDNIKHKLWKQFIFIFKLLRYYKKEHYHLGVGVSVSMSLLSAITGLKSVVLDDDDKKATPLFAALAHPFADTLLRPSALIIEGIRSNTIYYDGYHELSYLHPSVFKPDKSVLIKQGLNENTPFFILRLVALKAHHDKGAKGISNDQANSLIQLLSKYGSIFVSHENGAVLLKGTEVIKIHPAKLHDLMAYARMVISDGQTMCSEAACLGVPSVRINDFSGRISYLEEQEKKWELTYSFKPQCFEDALKKVEFILNEDAGIYKSRRDKMIANAIKVNDYLTWFIENYPESKKIMQDNPDYQYTFK